MDAAFLGNTVTNGPSGLLSISYSTVDTGASIANLDAFVAARYKAQSVGAELTHWVMSPATAEDIALLKRASGSNESLVEFVKDGLVVAGLPVLASAVDANTVAWGIPAERIDRAPRGHRGGPLHRFPLLQRRGRHPAIARDGFLHPAAVIRLYDAA